jgi:hypothetical protein
MKTNKFTPAVLFVVVFSLFVGNGLFAQKSVKINELEIRLTQLRENILELKQLSFSIAPRVIYQVEEQLATAEWMLDTSSWYAIEMNVMAEDAQVLEDWMLESFTVVPANLTFLEESSEPELPLEPWMLEPFGHASTSAR